jgi:hypothetical protein
VWQARIGHELAAQLRADAEILGLNGRTDIVKAALQLIHRRAAEERMARSVDEFYGDAEPPLPIGVVAAENDPLDRSEADRGVATGPMSKPEPFRGEVWDVRFPVDES